MFSTEVIASALILLSAALHAVVNTLVKVSGDGLILRGCMNAVACMVAIPFLFAVAAPGADLWPVLLASVLVHALYPFFLVWAYRSGDLSAVFPIMRGSVPLFAALLAWLVLGEQPGIIGTIGIALVSGSVGSLALISGAAGGGRHWIAVPLALATGAIIAVYTVIDAAGLRLAPTPFSYIVWLFVLDGMFVASLVGLARGSAALSFIRGNWRSALAAGAMGVLTYGLALYALALGPVAQIAALRETNVVFATILGAYVLREPLGKKRIAAALLAFAGIVLMHLGR